MLGLRMRISILVALLFGVLVEAAALLNTTTTSTAAAAATATKPTSMTSATGAKSTSVSCLYPVNDYLGNIGNDPDSDCMRPGNPYVIEGEYNPYVWATWDPPVASSCSSIFQSSFDQFKETGAITSYTYTDVNEDNQIDYTQTMVNYAEWFTWTPEKGSKCCLNCTLYGGDVQVYYWPTPAPNPAVTALVDPNNFTFISPTIYVAFESLYATDMCGNVGPTYKSTTLGFAPGELSTAMAWTWNGSSPAPPDIPDVFKPANWNDNNDCQNMTSTFLQNDDTGQLYSNYAAAPYSCHVGDCWLDGYTITWNPCSPTLSVPSQLFTLNSLWSGCMQGIDAFFDPPYTLTSGRGFTPLTITAPGVSVDPVTTSVPAQPAQTVSSFPASTTAGEDPQPTPTSKKDPGGNHEPNPTSQTASQNPPVPSLIPASKSPSSLPVTIGTYTLTPGAAPVVISQTTYSLDPSATAIIVDGKTSALPKASPGPSSYVVGSQTITPGAAPVVISQHTYSIDPSAAIVVIDGKTSALTPPAAASSYVIAGYTITPGGAAVTVDGTTYSMQPFAGNTVFVNGEPSSIAPPSPSEYVIAGQTLSAGGGAITVSGKTYSLAPTGGAVVVDGTTQYFAHPGSSTYMIGSQTLIAGGPAITVSGTVLSLMPGGSSVVVGGTTEAIGGLIEASTTSNGSAIISFGGFATPTSESTQAGSGTAKSAATTTRWDVYVCIFNAGVLWVSISDILVL